jgi:hypothetical protein
MQKKDSNSLHSVLIEKYEHSTPAATAFVALPSRRQPPPAAAPVPSFVVIFVVVIVVIVSIVVIIVVFIAVVVVVIVVVSVAIVLLLSLLAIALFFTITLFVTIAIALSVLAIALILVCHPRCHHHCPLHCCCHCLPTILYTVAIAMLLSPSSLLPLLSSLPTAVFATTIALVAVACLPPSLLSLPFPLSLLANFVAIAIALFVALPFTCPTPSLPLHRR